MTTYASHSVCDAGGMGCCGGLCPLFAAMFIGGAPSPRQPASKIRTRSQYGTYEARKYVYHSHQFRNSRINLR